MLVLSTALNLTESALAKKRGICKALKKIALLGLFKHGQLF
jgi:hypothetical protein